MRVRAFIALTIMLGACLPVLALDFPQLTGRVVDEANILDQPTRGALTQKLADLEAKTTDQVVVVTLKSLQGTSIEDFGVQLGRRWQIGQKDKNNGVLLIVAPAEHKVRIEIGYGLEGTLTDAVSRLIIENAILPRFRANDYPGGIVRGVDDIVQVLSGDAEEYKQRAAQRPDTLSVWSMIPILFFIVIAGAIGFSVIVGLLSVLHAILAVFGLAARKPRAGFWYWVDRMPTATGSSGSSGGSSSSSSSSSSDSGGFSGGGGSFGGGGSSGSW